MTPSTSPTKMHVLRWVDMDDPELESTVTGPDCGEKFRAVQISLQDQNGSPALSNPWDEKQVCQQIKHAHIYRITLQTVLHNLCTDMVTIDQDIGCHVEMLPTKQTEDYCIRYRTRVSRAPLRGHMKQAQARLGPNPNSPKETTYAKVKFLSLTHVVLV